MAACVAALVAGLIAPPAEAVNSAGSYLAGRIAVKNHDFDQAAEYYARALSFDPANPALMESTALAYLSIGEIERGGPIALRIEQAGLRSQIAHMIVVADLIKRGEYATLLERDPETVGVGPLVDGLVQAWALLGDGSVAAALDQFDVVAEQQGLRGFALYHKAMALALVGDFEAAEAIFADPESGPAMMTRRGAMARAEILSQLGRNAEAQSRLTEAFGEALDPGLARLQDRLATGEPLPFSHVTSVTDGMAEIFYSIAAALNNEANDEFTLTYARAAQYLRPGHIDVILLTAQLLEDLGQYDLAIEAYGKVPADSIDFHAAQLGRAEALRNAGRPEAATEVLERLAADYPDQAIVHSSLADMYRQQENYTAAILSYDRALELTGPNARSRWFLLYARGISHERLDQWGRAEADFRASLELRPDQPQVLNYLGYSLVEKQIKLDEALDMIERAVAARPDSGYIVDSLGWVLYRLGRYEEAVTHLERAVALMPVDPVVNDHLGDAYWAVGRIREAEFQWSRALSFADADEAGSSEADPDRIRRKLSVGLDQVLLEEGGQPLKVANDG